MGTEERGNTVTALLSTMVSIVK